MASVTLKSRLPEVAAELRPRVSAAVRAGAELVSERAAQRAPDRTPYGEGLVASIEVERRSPAEYAVQSTAFYARFVEEGTVRHSAQPFLMPALEESVADIEALVTGALRGL